MVPLARKTLVYEWRRFLPSLFAVAFSGLLLLVQAALVLGSTYDVAALLLATGLSVFKPGGARQRTQASMSPRPSARATETR